jgi:cyanophycin synthetase
VPEAHIQQIPDEQEAVESALRMARAGDLLLVFGDQITRTWKQIIHFRPDGSQRPVTAEYAIPRLTETPAAPEPVLGDLASLVRDERGVRLARELDD